MTSPVSILRRALLLLSLSALPLAACGSEESKVCTDQSCACSEGDCVQACEEEAGGCNQNCTNAESCEQDCPGGSCDTFCAETESCVVSCAGNDCDLNCTGASECRITDCTSGCDLNCNGAAVCENSCDSSADCETNP